MLKELNLKFEVLPTKPMVQRLAQSTAVPLPTPILAPSPGGHVAKPDDSLAGGSLGLASAPLDLMALASCTLPMVPEYNSGKDYCWAGDKNGWGYDDDTKPNTQFAD
jgi:hypothetical protein